MGVKIDKQAFLNHVKQYPEMTGVELAKHFGVVASTIRYHFKRLGIINNKTEDN